MVHHVTGGEYTRNAGLGGVTMNGESMMAMARERQEELETELRESYEMPLLPTVE